MYRRSRPGAPAWGNTTIGSMMPTSAMEAAIRWYFDEARVVLEIARRGSSRSIEIV
jgi:hypothetical protein